jgi:hypothetical protein
MWPSLLLAMLVQVNTMSHAQCVPPSSRSTSSQRILALQMDGGAELLPGMPSLQGGCGDRQGKYCSSRLHQACAAPLLTTGHLQVIPIYGRGSDFESRHQEAVKVQPVPPRPAGQRPAAVQVGFSSCSRVQFYSQVANGHLYFLRQALDQPTSRACCRRSSASSLGQVRLDACCTSTIIALVYMK